MPYNVSDLHTVPVRYYVVISRRAEELVSSGHVWVYASELQYAGSVDTLNNDTKSTDKPSPEESAASFDALESGGIVRVLGLRRNFLGYGFYNAASTIRIRLISRNANDTFNDAFWSRRVSYALQYRSSVMPPEDFLCCRLIFGEADGFPGLTVDRFDTVLSVQIACLGTELVKDSILPELVRQLRDDYHQDVRGVYLRNDLAVRELEGLTQGKGWYQMPGLSLIGENDNPADTVRIVENGIKYNVDFVNGQKTGFFLDQKYNRAAIRNIARGRRVLDCFTHTGSFGLNAAQAGAVSVVSVDISGDALEMAQTNAAMNYLDDRITYVKADVFDYLDKLCQNGRKKCPFDFIILDPPAFTKSRDTLKNAIKGYREINAKAMRVLPRGGYLATCSCSHFMTDSYFRQMLHNAAEDAGVSLVQIEARKQSPDHPILWNVPETDYLVFYIFQIV